jgi:CHASE3 domain sensor protein
MIIKFHTKYVAIWMLELFIALITSGSIVYYLHNSIIESEIELDNTRNVIRAIDAVLIDMLDAETGQRGYIISYRDRYLEPYKKAKSRIPNDIAILDKYIKNQNKELSILKDVVNKKVVEMDNTIKIRNTLGFIPTRLEIMTHYGKNLMDRIRYALNKLQENENDLLQKRRANVKLKLRSMTVVFPAIIIGNFLLIAVVYYFVREHDRLEYQKSKEVVIEKLKGA